MHKVLPPLTLSLPLIACGKHRDVRYIVTCGQYGVSYLAAGREGRNLTVNRAWAPDLEGSPGRSLGVTARSLQGEGSIVVRITCPGRPIDEATGSGGQAGATARGNVPI